jgi:hypothetical protein
VPEKKLKIAVDLDGTIVTWSQWVKWNHFGKPILPMVDRIRNWLADGHEVWIFTARMYEPVPGSRHTCKTSGEMFTTHDMANAIGDLTEKVVGTRLPATCQKHWDFDEFWDDKAVQVLSNTGRTLAEEHASELSALKGKSYDPRALYKEHS